MKFHRDLLQGKNNASNANEYFSIKFLADGGTISFTPSSTSINKLEYNVLGDNKWVEWSISSGKFTLSKKKKGNFVTGDIVMIRAKEGVDYSNACTGKFGTMSVSVNYAVFGNLMSIIKDGCKSFTGTATFAELFKGQTKLKSIGNDGDSMNCLPSNALSANAYNSMFYGCTGLTNTPAFTINSANLKCCYSMFQRCTSLTDISNININAAAENSYEQMFYGCSALIDASPLNINNASGHNCCKHMFQGCTSLRVAPTMNSPLCGSYAFFETFINCTTLNSVSNVTIGDMVSATGSNNACEKMFSGCTGLTTPPTIATMQTSKYCFLNMFSGCTRLTTAPALPATTLVDFCYQYMFNGCTDDYRNSTDNATNACTGIKSAGNIGTDDGVVVGRSSCEGMFAGCTGLEIAPQMKIVDIAEAGCYEMFKKTLLNTDNKTIQILATNTKSYCGMFYGCGTGDTFISPIDELYGITLTGSTECYSHMFYGSTIVTAPKLYLQNATKECCKLMFCNCTKLEDAENIIIAHTANQSCFAMFYGTKLSTNLPVLCATSVASSAYKYMFNKCNSIKKLPSSVTYIDKNGVTQTTSFLPAKTLSSNCYDAMFGDDGGSITTNYTSLYTTIWSTASANLATLPNNLLPATNLTTYCYQYMFAGTKVTSIPNGNYGISNNSFLPASTLKQNCYAGMFKGCTSLKSTTKHLIQHVIPSKMADSCYYMMFYDCTSLRYNDEANGYSIPTLNTTNEQLKVNCYSHMFAKCTNFNPSGNGEYLDGNNRSTYLPQYTMLSEGCYEGMFDSTDIKHYPILPATTLDKSCYASMLYGCSFDNTNIPDDLLHSTSLASSCYSNMFAKSNVTGMNALPATTLFASCYEYMFSGCKSLTNVPTLYATTLDKSCYASMFKNCTSLKSVPSNMLPIQTLASYCYEYMFSGCTSLTTVPDLPATTLASYCYQYMFNGCKSLTTVPDLPATTLASYCYSHMFDSCTGIQYPPDLPATTLASYCYQYMFKGCTSLTTTPDLPATTLASYCYQYMFNGCKSLTTIQTLQEALGKNYSYSYMFSSCSALTTIPNFKAIPGGQYCYQYMFADCSSLTDASAVTIGHGDNEVGSRLPSYCYYYMFSGCPLTDGVPIMNKGDYTVYDKCFNYMFNGCKFTTAPAFKISGSGTNSYGACQYMFNRCVNLIDASNIELASHCGDNLLNDTSYGGCRYMFSECSSLTTPPKLTSPALAPYCYQYMFYKCTSLTSVPNLPVTDLAAYCYDHMFADCSSIETAPELYATTLKDYCYNYMFSGCTSLKNIKAMFTTEPSSDYTYKWMPTGSGTRTFTGNINASWITDLLDGSLSRSSTTVPSGWTIVQE